MDITKYTNEWTFMDGTLPMPWLTHPFLDWLRQQDLKDKVVLELGGGLSTAWWRSHCWRVDTIDGNVEWARIAVDWCNHNELFNGTISADDINDGKQDEKQLFFNMFPHRKVYDIIIVDGAWRTESVAWAIDHFKANRGGILIMDNFQQDYVWISPIVDEWLAPYELHKYIQPNHTNHEGRPWQTVWCEIRPNGIDFYCQKEIEFKTMCDTQCDHCKEYFKPIEVK